MNKKKIQNENEKTFSDFTNLSWYKEDDTIKIGKSFPDIMKGDFQTIIVKEIFTGNQYQTWKIVIDKEDLIYLLKTSKELK